MANIFTAIAAFIDGITGSGGQSSDSEGGGKGGGGKKGGCGSRAAATARKCARGAGIDAAGKSIRRRGSKNPADVAFWKEADARKNDPEALDELFNSAATDGMSTELQNYLSYWREGDPAEPPTYEEVQQPDYTPAPMPEQPSMENFAQEAPPVEAMPQEAPAEAPPIELPISEPGLESQAPTVEPAAYNELPPPPWQEQPPPPSTAGLAAPPWAEPTGATTPPEPGMPEPPANGSDQYLDPQTLLQALLGQVSPMPNGQPSMAQASADQQRQDMAPPWNPFANPTPGVGPNVGPPQSMNDIPPSTPQGQEVNQILQQLMPQMQQAQPSGSNPGGYYRKNYQGTGSTVYDKSGQPLGYYPFNYDMSKITPRGLSLEQLIAFKNQGIRPGAPAQPNPTGGAPTGATAPIPTQTPRNPMPAPVSAPSTASMAPQSAQAPAPAPAPTRRVVNPPSTAPVGWQRNLRAMGKGKFTQAAAEKNAAKNAKEGSLTFSRMSKELNSERWRDVPMEQRVGIMNSFLAPHGMQIDTLPSGNPSPMELKKMQEIDSRIAQHAASAGTSNARSADIAAQTAPKIESQKAMANQRNTAAGVNTQRQKDIAAQTPFKVENLQKTGKATEARAAASQASAGASSARAAQTNALTPEKVQSERALAKQRNASAAKQRVAGKGKGKEAGPLPASEKAADQTLGAVVRRAAKDDPAMAQKIRALRAMGKLPNIILAVPEVQAAVNKWGIGKPSAKPKKNHWGKNEIPGAR
jgi:hypothetical protein